MTNGIYDCPELSQLLQEVENQLGIGPKPELTIRYRIFKRGENLTLVCKNEEEIQLEIEDRNSFLPEYEFILISDPHKIFIAHERLHAEIYRPNNFTFTDKNRYKNRLDRFFRENQVVSKPILNYFQDISVNSHLFKIICEREIENEYPYSRFLRRLNRELRSSLDRLPQDLNDILLDLPISRINLCGTIIMISMSILNYSIVLNDWENNLKEEFITSDNKCRIVYQSLEQFIHNLVERENWMVGRQDYENLIQLILKIRNWRVQD